MIRHIEQKREWKRLTSAAFDHPFYDRKAHRLSEREAEKLLASRDLPDGKAVIMKICRELEIDIPAVDHGAKPSFTAHGAGAKRARWIAAAAAIVLLICFFTMTKPGIALAKEISSVIVEWFTGHFTAHNPAPVDAAPIDFSTLPDEYEDIRALAKATGRTLVELKDPDYVLEEFQVVAMVDQSLIVRLKYRGDAKAVVLSQKLFNSDISWGISLNLEIAEGSESSLGLPFYVGTTEDNTVVATMQQDGYEINLKSKNLSEEEMKEILVSLVYVVP